MRKHIPGYVSAIKLICREGQGRSYRLRGKLAVTYDNISRQAASSKLKV